MLCLFFFVVSNLRIMSVCARASGKVFPPPTTQDHATGRHAKCSDSSELHRVGVLAGLEREPRVQVLREKIDLLARRNELVVDRLLERHTLLVDGLRLLCLVLRLFVSKQKCEKNVCFMKNAPHQRQKREFQEGL